MSEQDRDLHPDLPNAQLNSPEQDDKQSSGEDSEIRYLLLWSMNTNSVH
jgi:hypothetical protein